MQKSYLQENPFEFAYRVFCNVSLIFFFLLKTLFIEMFILLYKRPGIGIFPKVSWENKCFRGSCFNSLAYI